LLTNGMNYLWPTPVLKDSIKDQNLLNDLVGELFALYDLQNPPSDILQDNIFESGSAIIERFKTEVVLPAFATFLKESFDLDLSNYPHSYLRGWVAGYSPGYFMINHNHSGSHMTGVFYLLVEDGKGGELTLEDPRVNANRGYLLEMMPKFKSNVYSPKSGEFAIFPSFLYHYVNPFQGQCRLAIPVDFNLADKE